MDCFHNPYTLNFKSCPTWIRTKTNRTKNCRTTLILSDNVSKKLTFPPFLFDDAKIEICFKNQNANLKKSKPFYK